MKEANDSVRRMGQVDEYNANAYIRWKPVGSIPLLVERCDGWLSGGWRQTHFLAANDAVGVLDIFI